MTTPNPALDGKDVYAAWRSALSGKEFPPSRYFPTGLGGVEGHPQPGRYKIRQGGGYQNGVKQDHVWVPVAIYLVDGTGAPVHQWRSGLTLKARIGKDQQTNPHKIWLWCQKSGTNLLNAITQIEYNYWVEHGHWSDDAPAHRPPESESETVTAVDTSDGATPAAVGLGHNSTGDPEGYESLTALLAQQLFAVDDWIKQGKEGAQAAGFAKNWKDDLVKIEKRVLAAFTLEKAPILAEAQRIDAKWRNAKEVAASIKAKMDAAFNAISRRETVRVQAIKNAEAAKLQEELRAKAEAERKVQEEAHRIAREEAAKLARDAIEHGIDVDPVDVEPAPLPPPPPPPVVQAEQVRMTFGSGRKAAPKAVKKVAVISDWKLAAQHYCMALKVQEQIQKLADADANKGMTCPGSEIRDKETA